MLEFVHFGTVYAFFAEHRNGNTYTEKLFISVYTPQNNLDIITKSLKIKEEDLSIKLNDKIKLNADILPDTIKDINWSSSNESVASIDKNGQVIAKSQGTVLISAYTTGGMGKEDSIYVSVYEHINSIKGYIKSNK